MRDLDWNRLSAEGRQVLRFAFLESRSLGHPCLAGEHVVLGILRHGDNSAATLLRDHGLDLEAARSALLRAGPLRPPVDPADVLRGLGIEVDEVRRRLEANFGTHAVEAAERRVRRRPRWRGGPPRPRPICAYLLVRRSFAIATRFSRQRGDAEIAPHHLLYGVLRDAQDPLGARLGRRSRRRLAALGWTADRPNPLRLALEARGIDLPRLAAQL
jgi:hypothetical protein